MTKQDFRIAMASLAQETLDYAKSAQEPTFNNTELTIGIETVGGFIYLLKSTLQLNALELTCKTMSDKICVLYFAELYKKLNKYYGMLDDGQNWLFK